METEIIVAIITGLFTFGGVITTVLYGNKKTQKSILGHTELTLYRIEQLEKKQDKHNELIDRMYNLEDKINLMEEKINEGSNRINDLEYYHKP